MRSQSQLHNSVLCTHSLVAAVVLLVVLPTWAQNPVPPTAREAAASPAFASKLHPSATRAAGQTPPHPTNHRASPQDDVIYDNGPVNGTVDAWTINFGFIVSDTFAPNGSPVSGFDIYVWEFPGDKMTAVDWSITSAPFGGTVYGSGTVSGNNLVDSFISANQYGYNIDKVSVTGLNVGVTAGNTYWFNLANASVASGDPVFWDENSGPSQAYESALGTIPSEAFDIAGGRYCDPYCKPPVPCFKPGGNLQVIHDFTRQEGTYASGLAIDKSGNLYGTATDGDNGLGLVYEIALRNQNWIFRPLYSFSDVYNGVGSWDIIVGADGALSGRAHGGLANCGGTNYCGLTYSLRPAPTACLTALCGWDESVLYRFAKDEDGWDGSKWNGGYESGTLVFDQAGNLYGTTAWGGAYGYGTVYELMPSGGGWTEKVLYSFTTFGSSPSSLLVGNDGNLYGTTFGGGEGGGGTIFQLVPSQNGWTRTVLYNFQDSEVDGRGPHHLQQDSSGNLYGISTWYYWTDSERDQAIVFQLSPSNDGWTFTQLVRIFDGGRYKDFFNALIIDEGGKLYGSGIARCSECFTDEYKDYPDRNWIFDLVKEDDGWHYGTPVYFINEEFYASGLAVDASDNLYGVSDCGRYDMGTVWQFSPQQ